MKEFFACEMAFTGQVHDDGDPELACVPMDMKYADAYIEIYNACFYEMREALDVKPYAFYSEPSQLQEKIKDIVLYIKDGEIVGSVACFGNEVDDLIVKKELQGQGYGKQLLLWGMRHIREHSQEPITLHVAEWNQKALRMYEKIGFVVTKRQKVR